MEIAGIVHLERNESYTLELNIALFAHVVSLEREKSYASFWGSPPLPKNLSCDLIKRGYCSIYFKAHIHDLKRAHTKKLKNMTAYMRNLQRPHFQGICSDPILEQSVSPCKIFYEYSQVFMRTISCWWIVFLTIERHFKGYSWDATFLFLLKFSAQLYSL